MQNLEDTGSGSRQVSDPPGQSRGYLQPQGVPCRTHAPGNHRGLAHSQTVRGLSQGGNSIQSTLYSLGRQRAYRQDSRLHQELTVVYKLNHIPRGERRGPLCLRTQPGGKHWPCSHCVTWNKRLPVSQIRENMHFRDVWQVSDIIYDIVRGS